MVQPRIPRRHVQVEGRKARFRAEGRATTRETSGEHVVKHRSGHGRGPGRKPLGRSAVHSPAPGLAAPIDLIVP